MKVCLLINVQLLWCHKEVSAKQTEWCDCVGGYGGYSDGWSQGAGGWGGPGGPGGGPWNPSGGYGGGDGYGESWFVCYYYEQTRRNIR